MHIHVSLCHNQFISDTKLVQQVFDKASSLDKKVDEGFTSVSKRIDNTEKNLTERIDKIGLQLARLKDDAPAIDEFEKLVRRVTKLENRLAEN